MDERPDTVVIPTELERADAAWDIAIGLAALLGVVYLVKPPEMGGLGLPWVFMVPPLVPFALWVLTGEYAGDLPWVGGLAAGLRSKFGARRAHEWVLAWLHYVETAKVPVWRTQCRVLLRSTRRVTSRCLQRSNAAIRCWRSRIALWVSAIRSR